MKIWLEAQLSPAESGGAHYGGKKWLVNFNAGKTELVPFDRSNNTGAIDVKMDGSVLQEKSSFRCWVCLSLLNWIGALTLSLLLKLPARKLKP